MSVTQLVSLNSYGPIVLKSGFKKGLAVYRLSHDYLDLSLKIRQQPWNQKGLPSNHQFPYIKKRPALSTGLWVIELAAE
jgi:hypothetical protein